MKKLLLTVVIMVSVAHQEKAMDKDFSKQFFNELNEEYSTKNDDLEKRKNELMQQRNSLETNINLKKLNLRNREKDLKKNMERSQSLFSSIINTIDAVDVFNESRSIANDTNDLKPIQNELITVSTELSSNIKLYRALQELEKEYLSHRMKNPYLKKIKRNNPFIDIQKMEEINKKESKAYDEALFSLKVTKKVMEHNWSNVSWFQWLWNYRAHKQSMQELDDEIALFKDQDRVVSKEKEVFDRGEKIAEVIHKLNFNDSAADTAYLKKKIYTKSQLTHREVFTRSNMPQTMFEQVKVARE